MIKYTIGKGYLLTQTTEIMKNKKYITFAIIIQSWLAACPSYGQDKEVPDSLITQMEEALKNSKVDKATETRLQKRSGARITQSKAEEVKKSIGSFSSPLGVFGTTVTAIAASGDPHTKMAAAAVRASILIIQGLGTGIAEIVIGVSRYQERSLEILSITETLLEDMQKSIDKIKVLQKEQRELLNIGKTPEPSKSSSQVKKFGNKLSNAVTNLGNKVREATDPFTNEKAEREEQLKTIQSNLKKEKENFSEIMKLVQIKLLQDEVKEIDKKIDIEKTIKKLKEDIDFYKIALKSIDQGSVSKKDPQTQKQLVEIQEKALRASQDLIYYLDFQKSPGKETSIELAGNKSKLIEQIKKLTNLTKMGDSLYLQNRGIDPDAQLDKAAIVALYREIDELKKQIKELSEARTLVTSRPLPSPPRIPSSSRPLSQPSKATAPNNQFQRR